MPSLRLVAKLAMVLMYQFHVLFSCILYFCKILWKLRSQSHGKLGLWLVISYWDGFLIVNMPKVIKNASTQLGPDIAFSYLTSISWGVGIARKIIQLGLDITCSYLTSVSCGVVDIALKIIQFGLDITCSYLASVSCGVVAIALKIMQLGLLITCSYT